MGGWVFFVIGKYEHGVQYYSVARSRLDGKGSRRIIAANRPFDAEALVGQGSHAYWLEAEDRGLFIARASVDASNVDTRWRRVPRKGCHARAEAHGVAISSRCLFIGCSDSSDVDRVRIKGKTRVKALSTGGKLTSGPVLAATP